MPADGCSGQAVLRRQQRKQAQIAAGAQVGQQLCVTIGALSPTLAPSATQQVAAIAVTCMEAIANPCTIAPSNEDAPLVEREAKGGDRRTDYASRNQAKGMGKATAANGAHAEIVHGGAARTHAHAADADAPVFQTCMLVR